jgi:hypothetical protein
VQGRLEKLPAFLRYMKILFPNHPLKATVPDPDYQLEADAARDAGFQYELYSLEDLRAGEAQKATRSCSAASSKGELIIHRGWMMSDALYSALFLALEGKGYRLLATPEEYCQAHYFPLAYPLLVGNTPETVWVEGKDLRGAWEKYQELGHPAAIVKDFVKSAKHRWKEACFIPEGTERGRFEQIVTACIQSRGTVFEKGIVLRRYHKFVKLGEDIRGQPVHEEYRLFMWRGSFLAGAPALHDKGPYGNLPHWEALARRFNNPFISMDIAGKSDGSWMIVEVGDGAFPVCRILLNHQPFIAHYLRKCSRRRNVSGAKFAGVAAVASRCKRGVVIPCWDQGDARYAAHPCKLLVRDEMGSDEPHLPGQ